jgi:hypothetical protein
MFWLIPLLCFAVVLFIKAGLNGYRLCRLKKLESEYLKYVDGLVNNTASWDFYEKTPEIKELLIKAGQSSSGIPDVENVGVGFVQVTVDVFDNMTANNSRIASLMRGTIKQAIGVYKKRIWESFNPFYWIELLIFLPQKIFQYVTGNEDASSWLSRLLNAIYWLVGLIGSLLAIYDHFK